MESKSDPSEGQGCEVSITHPKEEHSQEEPENPEPPVKDADETKEVAVSQEEADITMSEAEAAKDRISSAEEEEEDPVAAVVEEVIETVEAPKPMTGTPPKETKAKKAQRTKRAKVSSTQNSTKPAKMSSTEQTNDASEEDIDQEEGGDDVAKIIQGLVAILQKVFGMFMGCFGFVLRFLCCVFSMLRRSLGVLFGALVFAGVTYLVGTYVMTPVGASDVPGFEARLKFLLRCQVWPTLPVFLAAVAGIARKDNEVHKTYGRDAFEQALMSLFNLLLLSTHVDTCDLVWVAACVVTATVFSLLHWFCLTYTKRRGSVFALPGKLLNFVVMAYNLYTIFGQNLGYVPVTPEPQERTIAAGGQGNTGWFS